MQIAIHQPNYIPWLGYFCKILNSDVFVFLDSVQYTTGGFQNRVKIKSPEGPAWLSEPLSKSGWPKLTKDIKFHEGRDWREKHLKTLAANYSRAEYFKDVFPEIENFYRTNRSNSFSRFNGELIILVSRLIGNCATEFVWASEMSVDGDSTGLLVNICKKLNAGSYLSGAGGKKYQSEKLFEDSGIDLRYANFKHPKYRQCWGSFEPGLSILDLYFNEGANSLSLIREAADCSIA